MDLIYNYVIDSDNDGKANLEDFLRYLDILINGNTLEKAIWSFKMLSSNKAIISYQYIEKLIYDISHLWNLMTDAKAIASFQYISQIYNLFDNVGDGMINFSDYFIIY